MYAFGVDGDRQACICGNGEALRIRGVDNEECFVSILDTDILDLVPRLVEIQGIDVRSAPVCIIDWGFLQLC